MLLPSWTEMLVFSTLFLTASVFVVISSGHFPGHHRTPALKSISGSTILWGSICIQILSTAIALYLGFKLIPWYAAIIGGGSMVLVSPLLAQSLSDRIVDGQPALLVLSALALVLDAAAFRLLG